MGFARIETIRPSVRTLNILPIRRPLGFFPLATCGFTLLLILLFLIQFSEAAQIRISWDSNTEQDLAGYRVYYGTASGTYGPPVTIGTETTYTITGLTQGVRYYIAVTAFDTGNNESDYSNEVNGIAPDTLLGNWDVEISGGDKGGAVLWFEDHTKALGGYGISAQLQLFEMGGSYSLNSDGSIDGTCNFYSFEKGDPLAEGNLFKGKISNKNSRIVMRTRISLNQPLTMMMRGGESVEEVAVPEDWMTSISGSVKGELETLKTEPYELNGQVYPHLFSMTGEGKIEGEGPIAMNGTFYLTGSDKVFGIWELTGLKSDRGAFGGKLDPVSGKFRLIMKGESGRRYILVGQAKTPG